MTKRKEVAPLPLNLTENTIKAKTVEIVHLDKQDDFVSLGSEIRSMI